MEGCLYSREHDLIKEIKSGNDLISICAAFLQLITDEIIILKVVFVF